MKVFQIHLVCSACKASFLFETGDTEKVYRCPKCSGILVFSKHSTVGTHEDTTDISDATHELSEDVRRAILDRKNVTGKFVLIVKIGEGGGGTVYKAFDLSLERIVALKVFSVSSDVDLQRTQAEAKVAAKITHPGIPRIYEVGSDGGVNYMSMELINGRNLYESTLTTEEAARVARDTARILAHAHSQGIVHRDVKPSNILLDRENRVFLTDFGIAKHVNSDLSKTGTGVLKGTPQFMSPEQAMGRNSEVDARSDVFSLGTTLYYLVTGIAPFEGSTTMEVIRKICSNDAPPPRSLSRKVPRDLEAIVVKAMEKDKARRYQSAAEMADDIDRLLSGNPVSAKPPSTARRIVTGIKKRFAVAIITVLISAGGLIWFIESRKTAEAREESHRGRKESQARTVKILDTFLQELKDAHAKALHLRMNGGKYELLQELAEGTAKKYRQMGIQDPQVEYALGLLYRMIGDEGKALEHQRKAGNIPAAHYELGILTHREYYRRIEELRKKWVSEESLRWNAHPGETREWKEKTNEELEDAAAKDLKNSARAHFEKSSAEGIVKFLEGNAAGAEKILSKQCESVTKETYSPFVEDSVLYLSKILSAADRKKEQLELLTRALNVDRGNTNLYAERAGVTFAVAEDKSDTDEDPENDYRLSFEDYRQIISFNPKDAEAWKNLAMAQTNLGVYKQGIDKSPIADFEGAVKCYNEAISLKPDDYRARLLRGIAKMNWAEQIRRDGGDPTKMYGEVIADYENALKMKKEITSDDSEIFTSRGLAYMNWGVYVDDKGGDPGGKYSSAIADLDRAVKLNSSDIEAWMFRGMTRMNWGAYLGNHDESPIEQYQHAVKDYDQAIAIAPEAFNFYADRANVFTNIGINRMNNGRDAAPDFETAIKDYSQSVKLNPAYYDAWMNRGAVRVLLAEFRRKSGTEVGALYSEAIDDYDAALKLLPESADAFLGRANARASQYDSVKQKEIYALAIRDYDRAIELDPESAEAFMRRGLCRNLGEEYESAVMDFDRAAKLDAKLVPQFKDAWDSARKQIKQ